ncbi:MAG TPA: DNA polymerase III subunit delta [Gemmatimonadaceae bacterium]|nr:DNA polymerase III subunit delta [Gemmatimonadaceae bacterium]
MASAGEKALHAALKKRAFDPVYFLFGEDDYLKDARTRELVEAAVDPATRDFNLELRRGNELDAETLDALLGTPPMLAERRVVVVRDVDKLKKDARALLLRYLDRPAPDVVLVLVAPAGAKADKPIADRSTAVEFAPLTGDRLPRWVAYHAETVLGRPITPDAVALLLEAVGAGLSQLAVELEKLASFAADTIDERAVAEVVGVRRGESVGALLDAVAAKDASAALALVPGVLQQPKTNAVSIVMSLTTQTLAMAYGAAARASGTPSRALFNEYMALLKESGAFPGRPWGEAVTAWARNTDRWSVSELDAALSALLSADSALKETRLSSDEQLLTSLVLALCGAGSTRRAA